jgi:hypothetical protein
MRADVARADRLHSVRTAAAGWRRAGAIDDATLRVIESAYPDDRERLGLALRTLAACAVLFGGGALAALIGEAFDPSSGVGVGAFSAAFAALFASATEIQTGRFRRAQAGAEYATALLAAVCGGLASISFVESRSILWGCLAFALTLGLAARRWGHASLAALAAILALAAAAQLRHGRAIWLVAGFAALPMIIRLARSPRRSPAHRECFLLASLVFLAGGYAAINYYSLDHGSIEWLGSGMNATPRVWERAAAIIATALVPPLLVLLGVRYRDRALSAVGALLTAASLVTLRHYRPIGPWWLSLVVGGVACLALAVALRRWLDAGPAHERSGFTAEPLFDDARIAKAASAAAVIAAMSPAARVASDGGFAGGGGRSGGGGATGDI